MWGQAHRVRMRALGALLGVALAGCAGVKRPPLSPSLVVELVEDFDRVGRSAAQFVADPSNPAHALRPNCELRPPLPVGRLSLPAYPAAPLAAGVGGVIVGVRIIVGTEGSVTRISDSPLVASTESPFQSEFRAAAEASAETWRFEPASLSVLGDGRDLDGDGKVDYQRVLRREQVEVYLDVRFDFEIVSGVGDVRLSGPTAGSGPGSLWQ